MLLVNPKSDCRGWLICDAMQQWSYSLCKLLWEAANKSCPSCALPIGSIWCIALEKIIEALPVACKHAACGGKEKLHYTTRDKHEKVCEYCPFHCPVIGCNYEGQWLQITSHFEDKHAAEVFKLDLDVDNEKSLLDVNPLPDSQAEYIIVQGCKESGMFLLHLHSDKTLCSFFWVFLWTVRAVLSPLSYSLQTTNKAQLHHWGSR